MNVKVRKTKKRKQRLTELKRRVFGRPLKETYLSETVSPATGTSFCPLSKLELPPRAALLDETSKRKFFGTGGGIGRVPGE